MTVHVDLNTALRILDEAVPVKGADHIQTQCYYIQDKYGYDGPPQPGCLVGVALWNLMGQEWATENLGQYHVNGDLFENIAPHLPGVSFDAEAVDLLNAAQTAQDGRHDDPEVGYGDNLPWGMAVEWAKARVGVPA